MVPSGSSEASQAAHGSLWRPGLAERPRHEEQKELHFPVLRRRADDLIAVGDRREIAPLPPGRDRLHVDEEGRLRGDVREGRARKNEGEDERERKRAGDSAQESENTISRLRHGGLLSP